MTENIISEAVMDGEFVEIYRKGKTGDKTFRIEITLLIK
jgi:hypothetical protein